jgi:DNA (cytosine-5)-methyltransferase 1
MKINHLDLFSGIGGFHLGFERAGFKIKSYFSEIDKHAIAVYKHKFKDATYVGSVTDVHGGDLPRIDLITFGSPCQDFSLAGKRAGMGGDRSSLILEAIRLVRECRPRVFIWENVKGAFSSNAGEDFAAILQEFADIGGYRLEWQLLNTSWFLPQNRERIYLVGYSTTPKRGWRGVFPIGENRTEVVSKSVKQIGTKFDSNGGTQPYQQDRVYDADGLAPALNQGKSDLIIKEPTIGAIRGRNPENPNDNTKGIEFKQRLELNKKGESNCLTSSVTMNMVVQPFACFGNIKVKPVQIGQSQKTFAAKSGTLIGQDGQDAFTIRSVQPNGVLVQPNYTSKALNETIENSNLTQGEPQALDLYNRVARSESPTLTEPHHNSLRMFDGYRIRRLTPIECERLQGFPDDHTSFGNYDGEVKPVSNSQRYKQCGNAVTVDVVLAVAKKCITLFK